VLPMRWTYLIPLVLFLLSKGLPSVGQTPASPLRDAVGLASRGDLADAEIAARKALNDASTRPVAYAILGGIRLQEKNYVEAATFLEEAVQLDPRLIGAHLNLANTYVLQAKTSQASAQFLEVLKLAPSNFDARVGLAQIERERGQYAASAQWTEPIEERLRATEDGLVLLISDDLELSSRRAQVAALVGDWLHVDHPSSAPSIALAGMLASHGQSDHALAILKDAEERNGPSKDLYVALGDAFAHRGDLVSASANFKLALDLDSGCVSCLYELARIFEQTSQLEEGWQSITLAHEQSPDNPDILFALGRLSLETNRIAEAIDSLKEAHGLRPSEASYRYVLASAYIAEKDYKDATTLFESLLAEKPDDPTLNYSLGATEYLESQLGDAEKHLDASLSVDPSQIAANYYLGLVKQEQGKLQDAERIFVSLTSQHPDHAPSLLALGEVYAGERKYPEAQAALEKALQRDPSSVKTHYQLGMVLARLGKTEAANKEFATVKTMNKQEDQQTELVLLPSGK
jgi:tetratricopeptide (TPR) repeat protein